MEASTANVAGTRTKALRCTTLGYIACLFLHEFASFLQESPDFVDLLDGVTCKKRMKLDWGSTKEFVLRKISVPELLLVMRLWGLGFRDLYWGCGGLY